MSGTGSYAGTVETYSLTCMLHPKLPEDAALVPGQDDAGKRVTITSCGGALVKVPGTVLAGPYTYPYLYKYKVKAKNDAKDRYGKERVKYKEEIRTSNPLWYVMLDGYKREFSFTRDEISFG